LHWFRPYQGIKALLEAGWQWLRHSSIKPLLQPNIEYLLTRSTSQQQRQQWGMQRLPFDFLLEGLFLEEHDAATLDAYESTVARLNNIQFSPIMMHAIRFPAAVPRKFVEMLEARDPRTLAIVGYFFMLLKRVERAFSVWWLQDIIDDEFNTLMDILPKKWWPKMEWAVNVFNGHDDSISEDFTGKTANEHNVSVLGTHSMIDCTGR
jgi:hypothetical protein